MADERYDENWLRCEPERIFNEFKTGEYEVTLLC